MPYTMRDPEPTKEYPGDTATFGLGPQKNAPSYDVDDVTEQITARLMSAEKLIAMLREENSGLKSRLFGLYEQSQRIAN